jgi:hypothetical protein
VDIDGKKVGFGVAIAILLDATLIRSVVLPSMRGAPVDALPRDQGASYYVKTISPPAESS